MNLKAFLTNHGGEIHSLTKALLFVGLRVAIDEPQRSCSSPFPHFEIHIERNFFERATISDIFGTYSLQISTQLQQWDVIFCNIFSQIMFLSAKARFIHLCMKTVHFFLQETKASALAPWKSAAVFHTRHRWKAVGQNGSSWVWSFWWCQKKVVTGFFSCRIPSQTFNVWCIYLHFTFTT